MFLASLDIPVFVQRCDVHSSGASQKTCTDCSKKFSQCVNAHGICSDPSILHAQGRACEHDIAAEQLQRELRRRLASPPSDAPDEAGLARGGDPSSVLQQRQMSDLSSE